MMYNMQISEGKIPHILGFQGCFIVAVISKILFKNTECLQFQGASYCKSNLN